VREPDRRDREAIEGRSIQGDRNRRESPALPRRAAPRKIEILVTNDRVQNREAFGAITEGDVNGLFDN
jgi:hypothetical protein